MVYKRQMPSRSLPPERLRIIERNQAAISKRNMAVDAGKSAYVRGKDNSLEERPPVKKGPMTPGKGRIGNDRYKNKRGNPMSRAEADRSRAISTNQRIVSARNIAADAGRSTYVRGKNNGLVAVPRVIMRRSSSDMDPGIYKPRKVPTNQPKPGGKGFPRPTRPRKPGDRRA